MTAADAPLANARHERFAQEYLLDLNAAAAYRRVYPRSSAKAADANGTRLLGNDRVAARIAALQAARAERVQITQDDVLFQLRALLGSDVRWFQVDDAGNLTLAEGAPDWAWKAVASIKHRVITRGSDDDPFTVREIEYRLWDKPRTVQLVMQHLGMIVSRHEHTGKGGGSIEVAGLTEEQRAARVRELLELGASRVNGNGRKR